MAEEDWSVQLKKIEREFDGLPPEPSPALQKLRSEEERRAKERVQQRVAMFGAGARLILVFALFAAVSVWPYQTECGWGLFSYLGVEAVIIAGGFWVAITTWRYRLPKMHILSLAIVLIGLALIAAEVLPRTGYASVDPKHPPQTWCPEGNDAPPATTMKDALPAVSMKDASMKDAPSATSMLERRVNYTTQSLGSRWEESSGDLVRRLRPQQAALARTLHRELQLKRGP